MSRNAESLIICRPSVGSCNLLALMYFHSCRVSSGREHVASPPKVFNNKSDFWISLVSIDCPLGFFSSVENVRRSGVGFERKRTSEVEGKRKVEKAAAKETCLEECLADRWTSENMDL